MFLVCVPDGPKCEGTMKLGRSDLRWQDDASAAENGAVGIKGLVVCGLINPKSGSVADVGEFHDTLVTMLESFGARADVRIADETDLTEQFKGCLAQCDVLLVAGGDGTILAAASVAAGSGKPLIIVPMGTMNMLGRDLGLPNGLAAVERLETASMREIDIGIVNERLFLNAVAFGSFSEVTEAREAMRAPEKIIEAWSTYGRELVSVVMGIGKRTIRWRELGYRRWRKSGALVICNNPVSGGFPDFFQRPALDTGELAVYDFRSPNLLLTLLREAMRNAKEAPTALQALARREFIVDLPCQSIESVIDGETATLSTPIHIAIKPKAMRVLVPSSERDAA